MNMPALPAISPSQPPAEGPARAADAGASDDSRAFSKVLSQQGQAAKGQNPASRQAATATQDEKPHDPPDPDSTLALILDSAALPLMQPAPAGLPGAAPAGSDTQAAGKVDTAGDGQPATATMAAPIALLAAAVSPAQAGGKAQAPAVAATGANTQPALADSTAPTMLSTGATTDDATSHPPAAALVAAPAGKGQPDALASLRTGASPALTPAALAASPSATRLHTTDASDAAQALSGSAAAGASLLSPASASQQAAPVITLAVPAPMGSPQWAQDLGRQMMTLTQSGLNGTHTVQLHVNPPELGPVHITLQIGDASTQAAFVSPHAHVRQALENALPALEQQFAQAGLSLGQANVSDQQAGQQGFAQSPATPGSSGSSTFSLEASTAGSAAHPLQSSAPLRHSDALVDTFV